MSPTCTCRYARNEPSPMFDVSPFDNFLPATIPAQIGCTLGVLAVFLFLAHCRANRISFRLLALTAAILLIPAYFIVGGFAELTWRGVREIQNESGDYLAPLIGASIGGIFTLGSGLVALWALTGTKLAPKLKEQDWCGTKWGWASLIIILSVLLNFLPTFICTGISLGVYRLGLLVADRPRLWYIILGALLLAGLAQLVPTVPTVPTVPPAACEPNKENKKTT